MEATAEKRRNTWYNGRILNNCSNAPDITHLTTYKNFREESFKKKKILYSKPHLSSCRDKWKLIPVLLPGKSHGRRKLVGFSSWGCKESDMTERFHFHFQRH